MIIVAVIIFTITTIINIIVLVINIITTIIIIIIIIIIITTIIIIIIKSPGLKDYTIMKCKPLDAGKFEYAVQENVEDGVITAVTLEGGVAKKNPLQSIRNVEFKVEGGKVTAVNLDGDCVKRKWKLRVYLLENPKLLFLEEAT